MKVGDTEYYFSRLFKTLDRVGLLNDRLRAMLIRDWWTR